VPYEKSRTTRRRLVETTARLLRTRGYAATGLSEIVADSGVPKGSLYHHFPGGKEQLASASLRFSGVEIVRRLGDLADRAGDPVRAVEAFCDLYVEQLAGSGFRKGCPLATAALETTSDIAAMQQACADAFGAVIELLRERLVGHGLAPGRAADAAVHAVAAIEGALVLAKAQRDTRPIIVVRDNLSRQLRELLREPEGDGG
jgi:TetR/AcrR family transcriptional repressor of lmrAB and yxaGH operons